MLACCSPTTPMGRDLQFGEEAGPIMFTSFAAVVTAVDLHPVLPNFKSSAFPIPILGDEKAPTDTIEFTDFCNVGEI